VDQEEHGEHGERPLDGGETGSPAQTRDVSLQRKVEARTDERLIPGR